VAEVASVSGDEGGPVAGGVKVSCTSQTLIEALRRPAATGLVGLEPGQEPVGAGGPDLAVGSAGVEQERLDGTP
jgi:hypothetical protein